MIKLFWTMLVLSFALSAVALSALPSIGSTRPTDPIPRPQPRPILDCWINWDTGGIDCRIKEKNDE